MIRGYVIHGDGLAKQAGYPTANLDMSTKEIPLKTGVYAAHATLRDKIYMAALVINKAIKKVEVHLLDYQGEDFYGEFMIVDPVQKVSEIEPLPMYDLVKKIHHDIKLVHAVLLGGDDGKYN